MTPKILAALKQSIATWERRARGERIPMTMRNCALCCTCRTNCSDCPVMLHTSCDSCRRTPYIIACERQHDTIDTNGYMAAARAEVQFLRSLLPTDKNATKATAI